LEERPSIDGQKKVPTFSGSWTFEIIEDKETENQVTLKITEQGVIKKPIVRFTHMLLFGFYRRIDRFISDLEALIAKQDNEHSKEQSKQEEEINASEAISHSEEKAGNASVYEKVLIEEQELYNSTVLPDIINEQSQNTVEKTDLVSTEKESTDNINTQAAADNSVNQQVEANDSLMTESKLVSGWDLVSEIYERPPKTSHVIGPPFV
jgi:midasin (ATPase involved in ribosome maturation)